MFSRPLTILLIAMACIPLMGQDATKTKAKTATWTLEEIFPKKSFFGPSARGMAFSDDGRFAAFLYRGYDERRHGNDLWLLDTASGKTERITAVSIMAKYQAETRKVQKDRLKKKKKKKSKKKSGPTSKPKKIESSTTKKSEDAQSKKNDKKKNPEAGHGKGDQVSKSDADDKKAPRYAGVSSFQWAPKAGELLFISSGDLYRFTAQSRKIERLTSTRGAIRRPQYLPNGKGYVYRKDDALLRIRFGEDLIDRIDPKLPSGVKLRSYKISPDGKRLVILATKGEGRRSGSRKVSIANYRDRFMKTREVPRHVSDDPISKTQTLVFVCEIGETDLEDGRLEEVWSQAATGPRDILRTPEWSEKSDRVVFLVFEQKSDKVKVVEATFLSKKERLQRLKKRQKKEAKEFALAAKKRKEEGKKPKPKAKEKPSDAEELENEPIAESKIVYEFMHSGGPNTPGMMHPLYLADGKRMVLMTEQSGFRQLHILDPTYSSLDQLTRGHFEVYPVGMSKDKAWLFVTATKGNPSCQNPYKVNLATGKMIPLSGQSGSFSNLAVSSDGSHVLANFVRYGQLKELTHIDVAKKKSTVLTHSHPQKAEQLTKVSPEFFDYPNRHGQRIYGHMFKPKDMKKGEKRPLLIYVYGGPLGTRKQVTQGSYSSDAYFFAQYMTREHGYITCTIDPRGMSGYGGAYERANFEQVGKPQVDDLVDGVKFLVARHGVDPRRVAIHGWSFGGFQTQMCLYLEPDVFKCGMAGAGPTEWENYNSWYSTGTIGSSRVGTPDLKKYSLLPLAKNLEGELLLIHGMEDANVLYQDTVRVYRELLKAGKETHVELFLDPTGGHGLGGDVKRVNKARKYEEFLLRNL